MKTKFRGEYSSNTSSILRKITSATSSVSIGQAVVSDGYNVKLANSTYLTNVLTHAGIATSSGTAGSEISIIHHGLVDPNIFNLGDGYACAVGTDNSGNVKRITDGYYASGLKYLGSCDTNGTITIQPKNSTYLNVVDFGATLNGTTDDTFTIQAALNLASSLEGAVVTFPLGATAKISKLTINYHAVCIEGNNAVLTSIATDGYVLDAVPISNVYPNNIIISNLGIILNGDGYTTGIRWRFTHSEGRNIQIVLQYPGQTGFELAGDVNGTGPYYNKFYGCNVQGTSNITQYGWNFTHNSSTPTRSPNANQFFGGRVGQVGVGWHIEGDRNAVFAPTIEGIVASGIGFDINHVSSAIDCGQNQIFSGYHEQTNQSGTTMYKIGSNASGTIIHGPFFTGISPGATITDSGVDTIIVSQSYTQFSSNGFILSQPNSTEIAQIKGSVPALTLYETSNNYAVAIDNEGGANAASFAFTVRDNIPRLLAAFGSTSSQIRATQFNLDNAGTNIGVYVGTGNPNGTLSANAGSIYLNSSGGSGTTLYVKETGSGNSGWVGK